MIGVHPLHITRTDPNHAVVVDPDTGFEYNMTVRPNQLNRIGSDSAAKLRLFVNGDYVERLEASLTHRQALNRIREHFTPVVSKLLNNAEVNLRFSQKAGCSCGCSPGFIVENADQLREHLLWLRVSSEG